MSTQVRRARLGVLGVFILCGFIFANWAARLPVVETQLDLSPSGLGVLLLFVSAGSLTGLPLTGMLVDRFGTARVVAAMASTMVVGMALAVTGVGLGSTAFTSVSLYFLGLGMGSWDVAMNVEAAAVEHLMAKSVMAQFHASWSLGTVAGAGLGVIMAWQQVSLTIHLYVVLVISLIGVMVSIRFFLPTQVRLHADERVEEETKTSSESTRPAASAERVASTKFSAWLEPRTLLIGVLILSAGLTEGAANDWIAVTVKSEMSVGYTEQGAETLGAVSLGVFLTAMTAMRLFGNGLLDRYGRVFVLRFSAGCAAIGLALFTLSPWLWVGVLGIALWGFGAALGFPVGMSAASDDPLRAARRVSVVASVGYTSMLAGPPLIGFIADHLGYRNALLLIATTLVVSFFAASKAAPLPGSRAEAHEKAMRRDRHVAKMLP